MKFVKKPEIIEAFRYGLEKTPPWMYGKTWLANEHENTMTLHTINGDIKVLPGDFIIKDINNEVFVLPPQVFNATYERLIES